MEGLLNPQTEQAPAAEEAQPQPQQQGGEFSEQEIKMVNLIIKQASQVLLEDKMAEEIAGAAKQGNPAEAIANAIIPVIKQVYQAASNAGKTLDMKVVALAGRELIKIVVAILGAAGIIQPEQASQVAAEAFKIGIQKHNQSIGYQENANG